MGLKVLGNCCQQGYRVEGCKVRGLKEIDSGNEEVIYRELKE
jgi:hypothetical protein